MTRLLPSPIRWQLLAGMFALLLLGYTHFQSAPVQAQEETTASAPAEPTATETAPSDDQSLSILKLYFGGGLFMFPITILAIIALTAAIERSIGIRRSKVLPEGLVTALGQLGTTAGGFDPRKAFRICQQYPSAASRVIRTMLLKVGRPISEIEHCVVESSNREATRLYANVRWLNLTAATAPLLGLLGTIQGMILAFHRMSTLTQGADKAVELSSGIYVALVTTFAGLVVAIPSVMFSHYFEGRIQTLFSEIDELVFNLLPQVERYEGRVRFSRQQGEEETPEPPVAASAPTGPPVASK